MLSRDTTRVTQAGPSWTDPLHPQHVLPRRRVIVHVGEPLARPEPEVGEADLGAVLGIVLPADNAEAVKVEVQKSEQTGTGFRLKAAGDFGGKRHLISLQSGT